MAETDHDPTTAEDPAAYADIPPLVRPRSGPEGPPPSSPKPIHIVGDNLPLDRKELALSTSQSHADAMHEAQVDLHTEHRVAPIDERIFSGFLEHMGRAVY